MVEAMEIKEGFKKTEVGIIPSDWNAKPLGAVLKVRHGKSQKEVADTNGEYPILASGGVIGKANRYLYNKPSVLIGRKGTIDKPQFMAKPFWSVDTLFYAEVFENYSPEFLYYIFLLIDWYAYNEASGVPSLNAKTIEQIPIPLPPTKAEQTAIATALNDADALITQIEKLIAKKRAIKQGAMQELLDPMVNGELRMVNDFNSAFTTQHSPFLKKGWEVKKLGEIFEITAGGDYKKEFSSNTKDDYHIYPIYSNSLSNKGLYGYCTYFSNEPYCITVTARGTIGYSCYRDHSFTAIGRLLVLKPKKPVDCFYFSEYINSKIEFILEVTGVPQLTAPQISQYKVGFPKAKAEQTRIAQILSDIDAEIEALENKLNKYKMLKQGMMQNLLTGRIRLV